MREASRERDQSRATIVETVVSATWSGPWWDERFGERGRLYIEVDTATNLDPLARSLRFGSPEIIVNHARWPRMVLTSRGICSLQIEEHVQSIDAEIDALQYDEQSRRDIQAASGTIATRVVTRLRRRQLEWFDGWSAGEAPCRRDIAPRLSFLADAVALDRSEAFGENERRLGAGRARAGFPDDYTAISSVELDDALGQLPDDAWRIARRFFGATASMTNGATAGRIGDCG